ncbi:MAG: UvrD-helicase domain-containing protein [Succinivibrionaceae bacterium]|nr:UvrD-helicase domain-containing protein [Succinivibrionaceae bacterium]
MRLNAAQQEAVDCIDGPCLVLAGAGSGKTRVIIAKITSLIRDHGFLPRTICAITFTNKAANEMKSRLRADLGEEVAKEIWISTFHSLGQSILRAEHARLGMGRDFTLYTDHEVHNVLRDIIREHFPQYAEKEGEQGAIQSALAAIARWKGALVAPPDVAPRDLNSMIYERYDSYLKSCQAVDFEDLISLSTALLRDHEDLAQKWGRAFEYVLVDEYQDTNETQYQLLRQLTSVHQRFTVVGDDDQSIYSWRGARPENINSLAGDYPGLHVVKLEQNYRSTRRILNCANTLISHNPHLFEKRLFSELPEGERIELVACDDEQAEAAFVAADIQRLTFEGGLRHSDIAVLYRGNYQATPLESAFKMAQIPYVVSNGDSIFDHPEVKDILCWCRLIANPKDDQALLRVINIPNRRIGADTIKALRLCATLNGNSIYETLLDPRTESSLSPAQMKALSGFIVTLSTLRGFLLARKDATLVDSLVHHLDYERYIKANSSTAKSAEFKLRLVSDVMAMIGRQVAGKRGEAKVPFATAVSRLLLRETLERREDGTGGNVVQLMTLHASKGLEFPRVYLIGLEDGVLPNRNTMEDAYQGLEEERRLAYVGITRARASLCLSYCTTKKIRGQVQPLMPSVFLTELPEGDLQRINPRRTRQLASIRGLDDVLAMLRE